MRKINLLVIIVTLVASIHFQKDGRAQQPQNECSQINYSTPEMKIPGHRLDRIEGQAVYASPAEKWELGSGNGVCVVLFDRKSKKLVISVKTDDKGQFEFLNVAPGEYVLIAVAGDLQKIVFPVRLSRAGKANQPRGLLLHLREREDTRRSYVTLVTYPALREELLAMVGQDQNIRNEMIKEGVDSPSKTVMTRISEIDSRNTARMKSIIKEYGWPTAELVGWDGAEAAFILIQHADHGFQKELLPLLQKEFRAGVLSGPNYALFVDHVLVENGKPQIYGTRARPFDQWERGEPTFYPIEDEANVDKRRAEVGLPPQVEYRKNLKKLYYPRTK
jgi:hypothetical protein